jgi:hypothetical protein
MEWFINQFLDSIAQRFYKSGKPVIWLTAKQTTVCKRYMDFGPIKGQRQLDLNGKRYAITIAPNGCSSFCIFDL